MPPLHAPFVSLALARLRFGVSFCCWSVAVALLAQVLVWGLATFMDMRYEILPDNTEPALIVNSDNTRPRSAPALESALKEQTATPVEANRVTTKWDRMMARTSSLTMSAGTMCMIGLIPLIMLGAILGACSATPGVEKSISSFMWLLVVAMLVLPWGDFVGLSWSEGGLVSYEHMTHQIDIEMGGGPGKWGSMAFYCRFVLMPMACVIGVAIVGLHFGSGVRAGLVPKESMRLDPVLEKEAANMTPTSLHGGRAAGALKVAAAAATSVEKKPVPSAMPPASELPKRLI